MLRHVCVTTPILENEKVLAYSERVSVVMGNHHAKRMRRIILYSVSCPILQFLFTLSHKRDDFQVKKSYST
jgi:hypothetical protein